MNKLINRFSAMAVAMPALLLLHGCLDSGPAEELFIKEALRESGNSRVCVALEGGYSYTDRSPFGGLPLGEELVPTNHTSSLKRMEQLQPLVSAGILEQANTTMYLEGELRPASRFRLTSSGLAMLRPGKSGPCLEAGNYKAAFVRNIDPSPSNQLKEEGAAPVETRTAVVQISTENVPEWVKAFVKAGWNSEQLTSKEKTVTLVKAPSGEWMGKQALLATLSQEARTDRYRPLTSEELRSKPVEELNATILALRPEQLQEREASLGALQRYSDNPKLPLKFKTVPGIVFFADTSLTSTSESFSPTIVKLKEALNSAKTPQERSAIEAAMEKLKSSSAVRSSRETDALKNARKRVQEELDLLVKAGAYTKQQVLPERATEDQPAGLYYLAQPGVVSSAGFTSGQLEMSKDFTTLDENGSRASLTVAVPVKRTGLPDWVTKLDQSSVFKRTLGTTRGIAYMTIMGHRTADSTKSPLSAMTTFIAWGAAQESGGQAVAIPTESSAKPASVPTEASPVSSPSLVGTELTPVPAIPVQTRVVGLPVCDFLDRSLPSNLNVVAAGAYSGRPLSFQIDQSGHQAHQFDVNVHADKPTALLLFAYEPTVWNVSWSKGTKISAVFATGYHRQAVAGLPPDVPLIVTSYEDKSPCGANYSSTNATWMNPKSESVFGKKVSKFYDTAQGGVFNIVESSREKAEYVTNSSRPVEMFRDAKAPLAGRAGIEAAVSQGFLRRADQQDIAALRQALVNETKARGGALKEPPRASGDKGVEPGLSGAMVHELYVVLKPFTIPAGLYGANSVQFLVPKGVSAPQGDPGHSIVYNLNSTNICSGPLCQAMSRD